ncbi:MAG: hypothetical protein K8M05_11410 [Deltaproteobacteria bacterium]|nr:hypothetical protein [Kofleriaceae bacterium]
MPPQDGQDDPDDRPEPAKEPAKDALAPGESGSVDVRFTDPEGKPAVAPVEPPRRKRAHTIPVAIAVKVGETVVHSADAIGDKVVQASDSLTARVGESLSALPVVPRTRRGRVMARNVILSFLLVFSWIAVIVGLQLRHARPPDFRPLAETILVAVRDGQAREVYQNASIRFQEVVLEETFVEQMEDMNRTLGAFEEISAVLDTEINRGPGGRTGRVDARLEFATGSTKGSMAFRWEGGTWKMLGIFVDVPKEVAPATQAQREARVKGPEDELRAVAQRILEQSARNEADAIWQEAALGFQQSIALPNFRETEADRRKVLGPFRRILDVTSARQNPSRTGASLQLLIEFEKATITGSFEFTKIDDAWKLTFFKLVLPLPSVPE